MHKFFVDPSQIGENEIVIENGDANHISKVLRLKNNEKILVNDGQGTDYYCIIRESDDRQVICVIEDMLKNFTELPVEVILFQGIPKQEKMEWLIQKCVELGISEIYPVAMKRCVSKLDAKTAVKKTERWNKIAESAAKQSARGKVPCVHPPISFAEVMQKASSLEQFFVPHENAKGMEKSRQLFQSIPKTARIGVIIGPEGGFSEEETKFLEQLPNAKLLTLGKRILRTETAAMAFLAMLSIMIEED